jgi:hypothetical protein
MTVVMFLLLLVIAAIAAGVHTLIVRPWTSLQFVGRLVAYALLLTLPALLPNLLGG